MLSHKAYAKPSLSLRRAFLLLLRYLSLSLSLSGDAIDLTAFRMLFAGKCRKSIDQEYVASPHQKMAARPLASWRMCVVASDGASKTTDGDGANSGTRGSPVAAGLASGESSVRRVFYDETSGSSHSGASSTI